MRRMSTPGVPATEPRHWTEYAIEAALLAAFMVSACAFTVLLEHPSSPARSALADGFARRSLIGAAMGSTAIALIHSPWGRRSGAHFNPAVTVAFHRLGKIGTADAVGYVLAQCAGGIAGVQLAGLLLGMLVAHPAVGFVATVPGPHGAGAAFAAEAAISFVQMSAVLLLANGRWSRFTGIAAGALVATWIAFEAPLSGMSMNPARSLGSALGAGVWTGFWVYLTAPLLGMLAAAELHARVRGRGRVGCAKLVHGPSQRPCILGCDRAAPAGVRIAAASSPPDAVVRATTAAATADARALS
jgi:aquaporin Z